MPLHCVSKVWGQSFFKEINTLIQQGCIKLLKHLSSTFIMLQKFSISNKCFVFIKKKEAAQHSY